MAMNIPAPVQILRYDIPENTTYEQAIHHIYETIKDGMLLIVNGKVVLGTNGTREVPKTAHIGLFIVGTKINGRVMPTFVPMMFGMNGIGIRLNTDGAGQNSYSSVITDIFPDISDKNGDSPFSDRGLLIGAVRRTNIDNISEYGIYWPSQDSTFPDGIDSSDCYVLHYADNGLNSRHFQFFMCPETSTPGNISDYRVLVYTRFSNVYYPSGQQDWSPWQPLGGGSSLIAGDGISITGSAVAVDNTVVRTSGGTLTGGLFGTSVALSESTIDVSLGYCFTKTITAATTFVFTGVPSNAAAQFSLVLTNGGSQTVAWPSSVKWSGGANPELAASGVDVFTFFTADGGTTWYGVHSVQGAA